LRQATAKASQSITAMPLRSAKAARSRLTLVRQSTTVPKTSKMQALMSAGMSVPRGWMRPAIQAQAPHPVERFRRSHRFAVFPSEARDLGGPS
jgi:hypothetical protein